jgi:hypothetical protein
MRFSTVQYRVFGSALVTAGLALAYVGCVSSDDNTTNNNPSAGGSGNTAGIGNTTGGSTGLGGVSTSGAVACPKPTQALITDFTPPEAGLSDAGDITFGDFGTQFSGGTFIYPTPALASDMIDGNWHISGTVGDYSGMGLYFQAASKCALVDASAYRGISFTISGTVNSPAPNTLTMGVSIAADTVANSWYVQWDAGAADPNFGTCVPPTGNKYDGSCADPQKLVSFTGTQTVTLLWSDFAGGKPAATIDPKTITSIYWYLPWTGAGQAPYTVDIRIDDLKFVE